jgi:hypothetical protein
MGSGKTTVGTLLARQLAWRFVDLDERIEESAKSKPISFALPWAAPPNKRAPSSPSVAEPMPSPVAPIFCAFRTLLSSGWIHPSKSSSRAA